MKKKPQKKHRPGVVYSREVRRIMTLDSRLQGVDSVVSSSSTSWRSTVKAYLKTAAVALAAYAVVAMLQSQMTIPVVGKYLPR